MDSTAMPREDWPELHRARRSIVVVDVVESVRLMQEHESAFIDGWRRFVNEVRQQVLPRCQGRLVKSLGDGLLLEFDSMRGALAAATECHAQAGTVSGSTPDSTAFRLRVAIHTDEILIDALDIYGAAVNLTARLATLAQPGETVLSDAARDEAVDRLDGEIEDLGECYLKHLREPVRAWRLRSLAPGAREEGPGEDVLRASIAVQPFEAPLRDFELRQIAEVVADDLTHSLCLQPQCRVVSRLSAVAAARHALTPTAIGRALRARYVVCGQLQRGTQGVALTLRVVDTASADEIWSESRNVSPLDVLKPAGDRLGCVLAAEVLRAVMRLELHRWAALPLPNLSSYAALLGCIAAMHRMSRDQTDQARQGLELLADRHPRDADPLAWFAKWYVLRTAQGWSEDPAADAKRAESLIARSLTSNPKHSLALAIDGQIATYLHGDTSRALAQGKAALDANPNESLAWLYWSHALSNAGHAKEGVEAADRALLLSPLDPVRYLFDIFAAYAYLVDGQYERACQHARASHRANRLHQPSYPILIVSEMLAGHCDAAREHAQLYLALHPAMSVAAYGARHRGKPHVVEKFMGALREAGLPA